MLAVGGWLLPRGRPKRAGPNFLKVADEVATYNYGL